jgi:segregation and condensation protein A
MTGTAGGATETSWASLDPSGWEDPPPARSDTAPVLAADGVAGPLDWLLEMVRAEKIDLARLPIGALIAQFADALAAALAAPEGRQVERWAGWTVLAATLTELRSRLLRPADPAASRKAEADAEALRRQLLDRARMRAGADWLDRRAQLGREVFARGMPELTPARRAGDLTDLLRACLVALAVPEALAAAYRPRPPPLWRVSDAMAQLRRLLAVRPGGGPLTAFLPRIAGAEPGRALYCRAAVASTLVAGLELARDGALALAQDAAWAPIQVSRPDDGAARPPADAVPAG